MLSWTSNPSLSRRTWDSKPGASPQIRRGSFTALIVILAEKCEIMQSQFQPKLLHSSAWARSDAPTNPGPRYSDGRFRCDDTLFCLKSNCYCLLIKPKILPLTHCLWQLWHFAQFLKLLSNLPNCRAEWDRESVERLSERERESEKEALKTKRMRGKPGERKKKRQGDSEAAWGVVVMYLQCSMSVQLYFTASSSRRQ